MEFGTGEQSSGPANIRRCDEREASRNRLHNMRQPRVTEYRS